MAKTKMAKEKENHIFCRDTIDIPLKFYINIRIKIVHKINFVWFNFFFKSKHVHKGRDSVQAITKVNQGFIFLLVSLSCAKGSGSSMNIS